MCNDPTTKERTRYEGLKIEFPLTSLESQNECVKNPHDLKERRELMYVQPPVNRNILYPERNLQHPLP